jgi:hypothetical protein
MSLYSAMTTKDTTTTNGMAAHSTTGSSAVDLFFKIGASRNDESIKNAFVAAYSETPDYAVRILQYARDVREGLGERWVFFQCMDALMKQNITAASVLLQKLPELGRWSDVLPFLDTDLKYQTLEMISSALQNGDKLCAKHMPRPCKVNKTNTNQQNANTIRKYMNLSPKDYRKLLVNLTDVVETAMCNNEFAAIDYSKVPSVAFGRYQRAFTTKDEVRFNKFIAKVEKGETKINASVIYPYSIIQSMKRGNSAAACAQWNQLPNYLKGVNERFLPVVDVSGSMDCGAGTSRDVTCMDVAVSLGLYLSERNKSCFKDQFITFSESPKLQKVTGDLLSRYKQMKNADWGMNTNLEKVFDVVLDAATKHKIPQSEMPTKILIMSDMQFDRATSASKTAIGVIRAKYKNSGYEIPDVVFWNLHAHDSAPAKYNKDGVALVSGFTPSMIQNVIGKIISPLETMKTAIMKDRYNWE